MKKSPNYRYDRFYNLVETKMNGENGSMFNAFWKFIKGGDNREPKDTITTFPFIKESFAQISNGIAITALAVVVSQELNCSIIELDNYLKSC